MATINGIFSTKLRGKVGDVVYRVNGQTNTVSQKPSSVSNPKSLSQQLQRMFMATAAVAYSQMKAICDHSFEGISGKQGNQAEFLRRNVRFLAGQNSAFNLKGNPYMMPNNLIISKGSLVGLGLEELRPYNSKLGTPVEGGTPFDFKGAFFKSSILNQLITKGASAAEIMGKNFTSPTVKEFCDAFGINYGSQITFVLNYVPQNYSSFEFEREVQLETRFKYCRIVLKATQLDAPLFRIASTDSGDASTGMLRMLSFTENSIDKEASENWDNIRIIYNHVDEEFGFAYSTYDLAIDVDDFYGVTGNNVCGNAIVSYKQDSKWLRSSEKLIVWTGDEIGNRDNVVRSYSPNDPKYLNNATPSIHVGKV